MTDPTEVKIETAWPQYEIEDLGLFLRCGEEPVFVSKQEAETSSDLRKALRLGAVRVSFAKRCLVSKPPRSPAPPSHRKMRPAAVAPSTSSVASVDEDKLAEKIVARLQRTLDERDARLRQEIKEMSSQAASVDTKALAAILTESLKASLPEPRVVVQSGQSHVPVDPARSAGDEPVYIPSKIVPTDVKANIKAAESKSDAGQADTAASRLAAMRKRKKETE